MPISSLLRFVMAAVVGLAALAGGVPAHAICVPTALPKYVGPMSNPDCNYPTIQAAIAANTACPVVIAISRQQTYTSQAITINNQNLTLTGVGQCGLTAGGRPDADTPAAAPVRTPIGGDGANPVFNISGTSRVTLLNLEISGGKGASNLISGAGGVAYSGSGSLSLQNVAVRNNTGSVGGVAYFGSGTLNLAGVSIHDNTSSSCGGGLTAFTSFNQQIDVTFVDNPDVANDIYTNHASDCGGGIYAAGGVHLEAVSTRTGGFYVRNNDAANGGGIDWQATRGADLGFYDNGISGNSAVSGGGLAVRTASGAPVRVFGTRPDLPAVIEGNRATTGSGGGIYVTGGTAAPTAKLCLFDVSLALNKAQFQGSAAAVKSGGVLSMNPENDPDCAFNDVAAIGAVRCDATAPGNECGSVLLNAGQNPGGTATDASVLAVGDNAQLLSRRTRIYNNSGGSVLAGDSSVNTQVDFRECLFHDNTISGSLLVGSGATMSFDACAFTRDSIGATAVIAPNSQLTLTRSIVYESVPVYAPSGSTGLAFTYAIFNNPKLATNASVIYSDPRFIDPANGNFHLDATSPGIDFAPTGDNLGGDLDRQPREVDYPGVTAMFGNRDAGPYERQGDGVTDRIFLGKFE